MIPPIAIQHKPWPIHCTVVIPYYCKFAVTYSVYSFHDVSTEPPLKVKINTDILEASQLNSEAYPPHYNLAKGFTVYGEACRDECTYRDGYPYTWCHKVASSKTGTWSGSDYCTNNHKMTHQVRF